MTTTPRKRTATRVPAPEHNGRVTAPAPRLSKRTLEYCDMLLNVTPIGPSITPTEMREYATAKEEVADAVRKAGGTPIIDRRSEEED